MGVSPTGRSSDLPLSLGAAVQGSGECSKGGQHLMTTKRIAKALCAWMVLGAALLAQSITSNIVGIVTDPAGASIPGAEIQVKER